MENEIEALIVQSKKIGDEINSSLDVIIEQNDKNNIQPELEAIAKSNIDTKNSVEEGNKDIIKAIGEIKFPEQKEPVEEVSIKNIAEVNKSVIEKLVDIKEELTKPQEINITLELI